MKKIILIAEDVPILRKMMALDLEEKGAIVELAQDGEEAMAVMDKRQPALLLLDLLMPKKDGYAVLRHVHEKGYHFPVVMLSNLSDPIQKSKCLELGAKDFIVKSQLDSGDLWERVRGYLNIPSHRHALQP